MILLTSTSDLIQIVTASAVTVDVHASWADHTASAFTPNRTNTAITTAATTTVVGSPAAATQRQLKTLTLRNRHASSSNAVTVQHTDGTTTVQLIKVTLLAGELLQYVDGEGFTVFDANGQRKTAAATGGGTPALHAATHADGGTDPVALAASQLTSGTLSNAAVTFDGGLL